MVHPNHETAFHPDPISVGGKERSQMSQDPVYTGHNVTYHSSFSCKSLVSFVYLTVLYTCCSSLYELKCVNGHHIRRHTELDSTSDVFRWRNIAHFTNFLSDLCAIADISNINNRKRASDFKGTSTLACYGVL